MKLFANFVDLYGSNVQLHWSSLAFVPACWLRVETTPMSQKGYPDGAGHLAIHQAVALRDALTAWIEDAQRAVAEGSYDEWPEGACSICGSDSEEPGVHREGMDLTYCNFCFQRFSAEAS